MGSDAVIDEFDYRRYRDEVMPAVHDFLRTGEATPWAREMCHRTGRDDVAVLPIVGTEFVRDCDLLDRDLAFRFPVEIDTRDPNAARPERTCERVDCLSRPSCPLHDDAGPDNPWRFRSFVEALVVGRCLGRSQFIGRNSSWFYKMNVLDQREVPADARVRFLLLLLGTRGHVIGYRPWEAGGGIHGWLTPEEARDFADDLRDLGLPRFEPGPVAMQVLRDLISFGDAPWSWNELHLSIIGSLAAVAAAGNGLLWGNELNDEWAADGL